MAKRSPTGRGAQVLRHVLREGRYYGKIALIGAFTAGARGGTHVYDEEWDVLVVLDACRPDLIAAVEADYGFLADPRVVRSIASYSKSWMRRTFGSKHAESVARTAYVTGNPFSGEVLDGDAFAHFDEVWRYAWDDEEGTVLPRPITDRAIEHYREHDPERLVVHYMQPHHPFLDDDTGGFDEGAFPDPRTADPWDQVRRGQRDLADVLDAYRANLRYALDDVRLLLDSVDAERVVVTADHANAVGERGIYGHPAFAGIDAVREVPWYVTSARDTGEYEPAVRETDAQGYDPADQLEQLGYR
ncbi:hypothetical protein [Halomarina ordinaria]|uniref:Sulfatase-like hydrolase/transferase n=1 Tax=Halomarina ordinaria TaxID=3033939 RepID=A0ABD5UCR1_9EURY|nr:hypothetical protein [Halomarina sp. PSRA2]